MEYKEQRMSEQNKALQNRHPYVTVIPPLWYE